ncbi:MAG: hypothetical protein ACI82E_000673, partial [Nonlabens sp.]
MVLPQLFVKHWFFSTAIVWNSSFNLFIKTLNQQLNQIRHKSLCLS